MLRLPATSIELGSRDLALHAAHLDASRLDQPSIRQQHPAQYSSTLINHSSRRQSFRPQQTQPVRPTWGPGMISRSLQSPRPEDNSSPQTSQALFTSTLSPQTSQALFNSTLSPQVGFDNASLDGQASHHYQNAPIALSASTWSTAMPRSRLWMSHVLPSSSPENSPRDEIHSEQPPSWPRANWPPPSSSIPGRGYSAPGPVANAHRALPQRQEIPSEETDGNWTRHAHSPSSIISSTSSVHHNMTNERFTQDQSLPDRGLYSNAELRYSDFDDLSLLDGATGAERRASGEWPSPALPPAHTRSAAWPTALFDLNASWASASEARFSENVSTNAPMTLGHDHDADFVSLGSDSDSSEDSEHTSRVLIDALSPQRPLRIYNDAMPAASQPQTPVGLPRHGIPSMGVPAGVGALTAPLLGRQRTTRLTVTRAEFLSPTRLPLRLRGYAARPIRNQENDNYDTSEDLERPALPRPRRSTRVLEDTP